MKRPTVLLALVAALAALLLSVLADTGPSITDANILGNEVASRGGEAK